MASVRRSPRSRRTAAVKPQPEKQAVDVAAIRAKLNGAKKEIVSRRIGLTTLSGDGKALVAYLSSVADEAGIKGGWTLKYRSATSGRYRRGRYVGGLQEGYVLIGERDYTDDELATGGDAIVKQIEKEKARRDAARRKKVDKLNQLARELGVDEITPA